MRQPVASRCRKRNLLHPQPIASLGLGRRTVESASLARTVGERSSMSSCSGGTDVEGGGNRPPTVQHVAAERKEQSGAGGTAVDEDRAAAHPQSHTMVRSTGKLGISRMGSSPFLVASGASRS
jgi:hypothetical protein